MPTIYWFNLQNNNDANLRTNYAVDITGVTAAPSGILTTVDDLVYTSSSSANATFSANADIGSITVSGYGGILSFGNMRIGASTGMLLTNAVSLSGGSTLSISGGSLTFSLVGDLTAASNIEIFNNSNMTVICNNITGTPCTLTHTGNLSANPITNNISFGNPNINNGCYSYNGPITGCTNHFNSIIYGTNNSSRWYGISSTTYTTSVTSNFGTGTIILSGGTFSYRMPSTQNYVNRNPFDIRQNSSMNVGRTAANNPTCLFDGTIKIADSVWTIDAESGATAGTVQFRNATINNIQQTQPTGFIYRGATTGTRHLQLQSTSTLNTTGNLYFDCQNIPTGATIEYYNKPNGTPNLYINTLSPNSSGGVWYRGTNLDFSSNIQNVYISGGEYNYTPNIGSTTVSAYPTSLSGKTYVYNRATYGRGSTSSSGTITIIGTTDITGTVTLRSRSNNVFMWGDMYIGGYIQFVNGVATTQTKRYQNGNMIFRKNCPLLGFSYGSGQNGEYLWLQVGMLEEPGNTTPINIYHFGHNNAQIALGFPPYTINLTNAINITGNAVASNQRISLFNQDTITNLPMMKFDNIRMRLTATQNPSGSGLDTLYFTNSGSIDFASAPSGPTITCKNLKIEGPFTALCNNTTPAICYTNTCTLSSAAIYLNTGSLNITSNNSNPIQILGNKFELRELPTGGDSLFMKSAVVSGGIVPYISSPVGWQLYGDDNPNISGVTTLSGNGSIGWWSRTLPPPNWFYDNNSLTLYPADDIYTSNITGGNHSYTIPYNLGLINNFRPAVDRSNLEITLGASQTCYDFNPWLNFRGTFVGSVPSSGNLTINLNNNNIFCADQFTYRVDKNTSPIQGQGYGFGTLYINTGSGCISAARGVVLTDQKIWSGYYHPYSFIINTSGGGGVISSSNSYSDFTGIDSVISPKTGYFQIKNSGTNPYAYFRAYNPPTSAYNLGLSNVLYPKIIIGPDTSSSNPQPMQLLTPGPANIYPEMCGLTISTSSGISMNWGGTTPIQPLKIDGLVIVEYDALTNPFYNNNGLTLQISGGSLESWKDMTSPTIFTINLDSTSSNVVNGQRAKYQNITFNQIVNTTRTKNISGNNKIHFRRV